MRGSTHSLHEEKIDRSKNRCIRQKTWLFGFGVRQNSRFCKGVKRSETIPFATTKITNGLWGRFSSLYKKY